MTIAIIIITIICAIVLFFLLGLLTRYIYNNFINAKQDEDDTFKVRLTWKSIYLLVIAFFLVVISFIIPIILTQTSITESFDFSETGQIGDTIGGLMNPFIALSGVLVTGLAFYMQYKANLLQRKIFYKQLEEEKLRFTSELDNNKEQFDKQFKAQENQIKLQQFETQFYEMLRLHRENVNELYIKIRKKIDDKIIEETIYGRNSFEYLTLELSLCYMVALYSFKGEGLSAKKLLNEAYGIFFHGFRKPDLEKHQFFKNIHKLQILIENFDYEGFEKEIDANVKIDKDAMISERIEFRIFFGYNHQLAHYYRHLFQTVKFVVQQDETLISYSKKRNYLRILRAQLSNSEQVLLFYNWHSDFGKQWEDKNNKFLTDYRMIHNLYDDLLISQFELDKIFDISSGYKKESDRDSDNLFEFQDW